MPAPTTLESLMAKVAKDPRTECWNWTGFVSTNGYGQVGFRRRMRPAHRVIYELIVGVEVAPHLDLDHLCRNRRCCNPRHLEPVDRQTNVLRGEGLAAINAAKTHCVNGHEFTPENTYLGKGRSGRQTRVCRACGRAATDRYNARKRTRK